MMNLENLGVTATSFLTEMPFLKTNSKIVELGVFILFVGFSYGVANGLSKGKIDINLNLGSAPSKAALDALRDFS